MASSQDERWSSVFDPKLAALLSELELGLGSVVRQTGAQPPARGRGTSEDDVLGKKEGKDRRKNGRRSFYSTLKIYIYAIIFIDHLLSNLK